MGQRFRAGKIEKMKALSHILWLFLMLGVLLKPSMASGQFLFFEHPFIGRQAPDFTLKTLKGESMSLTQYRAGKSAIVFFWATWCPHCRAALKSLHQEKQQIEAKDIQLILVNLGENKEHVRSYLTKNKMDFDIFLDTQNSLPRVYEIDGIPTFFLIDRQGVVKAVEHTLPTDYDKMI